MENTPHKPASIYANDKLRRVFEEAFGPDCDADGNLISAEENLTPEEALRRSREDLAKLAALADQHPDLVRNPEPGIASSAYDPDWFDKCDPATRAYLESLPPSDGTEGIVTYPARGGSRQLQRRRRQHNKLLKQLRAGYYVDGAEPQATEAARAFFQPLLVQAMGREILFECRVLRLVRADELKVEGDSFRLTARTLRWLPVGNMRFIAGAEPPDPLVVYGPWTALCYRKPCGVKMDYMPDTFHLDPGIVAAVKAAHERDASPEQIRALLAGRRSFQRAP